MLARGELDTTASGDDLAPEQDLDAALAAFGLELHGAAAARDEVFHLWPEHVPALGLWGAVQTQWRQGFGGPTGLDYAGVRASPAFCSLPRRRRERVFGELCIMERATLAEWAEQRRRAG